MEALLLITTCMVSLIVNKYFKDKSSYTAVVLFLVMTIVMGLSYGQADYLMYKKYFYNSYWIDFEHLFDYSYSTSHGISRDSGYILLNKPFYSMGFSYENYKFISSAVLIGTMFYYTYKITKSYLLVMVMYAIYPFLMDAIQVRNSYVELLLFVALYYLSRAANFSKTKYVLIVLFSATIHSIGAIYLVFLPFYYMLKHKYCKYIVFIPLIIGLAMPLYSDYMKTNWWQVAILFQGDADDVTNHYYNRLEADGITKDTRSYAQYTYIVIMCIFTQWMSNIIQRDELIETWKKRFSDYVAKINLYMIVFFPFYPLIGDMYIRPPRNNLILMYILVAIYISNNRRFSSIVSILIMIASAVYFARLDLFNPGIIFNVDTILNNNWLFDMLPN